jgi:hypothetical protein
VAASGAADDGSRHRHYRTVAGHPTSSSSASTTRECLGYYPALPQTPSAARETASRNQGIDDPGKKRMEPALKVFLSHASCDQWVARQLAARIHSCGADVFLDADDLTHGDDFEARILAGAEDSHELLVLLTPAARERRYVWLEIGMFFGARKRIVAALYGISKDELATDRLMPIAIKRVHTVDINDIDTYFSQLAERVRSRRSTHA